MLAGCGSDGIDDVRAKVDYDESKPVKVEISRDDVFTEIEFQSPRGTDVPQASSCPGIRRGRFR